MSRNRTRLFHETLERRIVLAATVTSELRGDVLFVDGTSSSDEVYVRDAGRAISVVVGESVISSFSRRNVASLHFSGRAGDDVFHNETDLPAEIFGGNGNDQLFGGANRDKIWGNSGQDEIVGGDGNDQLHGGNDGDTVRGGLGNDQIFGDAGNDVLHGNEGDDRIRGNSGTDTILGGPGDDALRGDSGNDTLNGGDGDDELRGGASRDRLVGSYGDDRLFGEASDDILFGDDGEDFLDGGPANDEIYGGTGDDRIVGGSGHDLVLGHDGNDAIVGGTQRDVIIGGEGRDRVQGGPNDDLVIGGSTSLDDEVDPAELKRVHRIWRGSGSYDQRVEKLQTSSHYQLIPEETVLDDGERDMLVGNSGEDWFFLTGRWNQLNGTSLVEFLGSLDTVSDRADFEHLESVIPHAGQTRVHLTEHHAMLDLVNYTDVTHTVVKSGDWSDRSIWANQVFPNDGARVLIPAGLSVTVDNVIPTRLKTVRVDGMLQFAPSRTTELAVDTLVAAPGSSLLMGTAEQPIESDVTARLLVIDDFGEIDRTWDPFGFSRGVLAHGKVEVFGMEKTPFAKLETSAMRREKQLVLDSEPLNWKPGDKLVLAGSQMNLHEELEIASVEGNIVHLTRRLRFDHVPANERMSLHVANLTRNAKIESENSQTRRGHLMFMHNRDVSVNYLGIQNLGRTNKRIPLNDSRLNRKHELREGTGENQRGRYALHFHRNGVQADGHHHTAAAHTGKNGAAKVHGTVINDSAGWGYVNHSSFVDFTSNVAYDVDGSSFVTEAGDEIGSFVGNLAIRGRGSGDGIESRRRLQDFAHQGDGFWFQGGGVRVVDNVAMGQTGHGFVFFTRALEQDTGTTQFLTENLKNPRIANGNDTIRVGEVPLLEFRNNEAYANNTGTATRFHKLRETHNDVSLIEDLRLWNNNRGLHIPYTNRTTLRNVEVIGDPDRPSGFGISRNNVTRNITYEDITVEGFRWGVQVPLRGENVLASGRLNNIQNVVVGTAVRNKRVVRILDAVQFETPSNLRGSAHYDVAMQANLNPHRDSIAHVFGKDTVLWESPRGDLQLYFSAQAAEFTPFPKEGEFIPSRYVGKTNEELQTEFFRSLGGQLLPDDAFKMRGVRGYVSEV